MIYGNNSALYGASINTIKRNRKSYLDEDENTKPKRRKNIFKHICLLLLYPLLFIGVYNGMGNLYSYWNPDTLFKGVVKYKHISKGRVEHAILVVNFEDGNTRDINVTYNTYYSSNVGDTVSFQFPKRYWSSSGLDASLFIFGLLILIVVGISCISLFVYSISRIF